MNRERLASHLPIAPIALASALLSFWGLTRSGFANTYYAEAAQAASRSWSAWLTNATDASLSVSLDKGPLPNMMLGLSGRLFGFSSFSLLLPEALCGVGAVLLLYDAVRRTLGRRVALLAAAMLALTPIFVAMSRFDNPDALLVLLEVGAAWALVRALQSGRTAHVLLCGALVGLAFNVKMLQAYLIVPGLAAALLLAGQGSVRRRLEQLIAGAGAMLAVSFAWYGTTMLVPASSRPWVGDTTDNSWFSLIFGANGFGRVSGEGAGPAGGGVPGGGGPGGATGFGGSAGLTRLFNDIVGGQIAWLLPLAALGLALGLWTLRRAPRADLGRAAYVLWGGWALVSWLVFSLAEGIFHPYYTTALAPAVAVLAAGGLALMWERARSSSAWTVALAAALVGTVALAAALLGRTGGVPDFLGPLAIVLALAAAGGLVLVRLAPATRRPALLAGAVVAGLAAVLAGPAAYSIATTGRALSGGNPLAGPRQVEQASGPVGPGTGRNGAFALAARGGGAPASAGAPALGGPAGSLPGARPGLGGPAGPSLGARPGLGAPPGLGGPSRLGLPPGLGGPGVRAAGGAGPGGGQVSAALVHYLQAHRGSAKYVVAAEGSMTAGSIAVQSKDEAIDMGGFTGSDPAPSLSKLQALIRSGQLHYVLLGASGNGAPGPRQAAGAAAVVTTRDAWVRSHGSVVHATGLGAGGGTLYYFA
ncbi:MAG TPA: glycosyltransferase family 39 protein [Solirubrobacteraceae bacterium]|nr:glycosyltransferase family 39 protein [Solirubrobacteraceae bacterium]